MAHFAKLNEDNTVIAVHVVNNDVITIDGVESEQAGIDFLTNLHGHPYWKQTSYNGSFRKNYASAGYSYDASRDAFIQPKPFPSWILNETTCRWEAPTPYPVENGRHIWDEENQVWVQSSSNNQ